MTADPEKKDKEPNLPIGQRVQRAAAVTDGADDARHPASDAGVPGRVGEVSTTAKW